MAAILAGSAGRLRREHNERAWLAWHTAVLTRMKKLPKLKSLQVTGAPPRKRRKTVDEQIAIALAWTAAVKKKR